MRLPRVLASVAVAAGLAAGCGGANDCALCDAAAADDLETVTRLLAGAPTPGERAALADSALYRMTNGPAVTTRQHYPAIASALFRAGANPHQDRVYRTTGRSRSFIAEDLARLGDELTLAAFIAAGFDVKGEPGAWTLLAASQASANEAARLLMEAGADPNRRLLDTTALETARKAGDQEMVAILAR